MPEEFEHLVGPADSHVRATVARVTSKEDFTLIEALAARVCEVQNRVSRQVKTSHIMLEALAAHGKCREDATYMVQNCLQTCAALDVDAVVVPAGACGGLGCRGCAGPNRLPLPSAWGRLAGRAAGLLRGD